MTGPRIAQMVGAVVALISIFLLFTVPAVGFVAVALCFILIAPWGKSLSERAVISGLVLLGIIALAFPRAGSLTLDHMTSRVLISATLLISVAIGFLPRLREGARIPKPRWVDVIVLGTGVVAAWSPIVLYRGLPIDKVISGLYVAGWDNQGHFNTFANTLAAQSTTWPTVDGVIAWNQWYPSLHTTAYAVMQNAISDADLNRLEMVTPFAIWSALFFAACLAALVYVASDIARRWARMRQLNERTAAIVGAVAAGISLLLGSVQNLFNAGFTNFVMAAAITIVASYLVGHSMSTARSLGWFLIPLSAVSVIGLWTPLVLGLIPAGIITFIALVRWRRWVGIGWLIAAGVGGVLLVVTQLQAILAGSQGVSVAEFNEEIGQVGVGMAPFNLGLGMAAPILTLLLGFIIWRHVTGAMAWSVAFPAIISGVLAVYFISGTDAAGISRLNSYYVLKALDASVIMATPLIVAAIAVAITGVVTPLTRPQRAAALGSAGLLGVTAFGYVGVTPELLQADFRTAPGIAASQLRIEGAGEQLVGSAIEAAARAAQSNADYVPLLWDGSGQLVNLWVGSLTNTMSTTQTSFYAKMQPFPYEEQDLGYLDLSLNTNPDLSVNVLWFRPSSGELLKTWSRMIPPQRVITTRLAMPSTPLCPECTGK